MMEIEQALADLPRLTRSELEKVRVSINLLSTNQRHRFFSELMLWLGEEMISLGHATERNREAVEKFDDSSRNLSWWLIGLTGVLVILTIAIAGFTIVLAFKK